jgi:hypothetical protein
MTESHVPDSKRHAACFCVTSSLPHNPDSGVNDMMTTAQKHDLLHNLESVELKLTVTDPEIVAELLKHPEGEPRELFGASSLRLGVLALRQASGMVDADAVKREGERLLFSVSEVMTEHSSNTIRTISDSLSRYFDPGEGQLPQRLNRLLAKDGELEQLLSRHVGNDGSTLAGTLAKHVGEESALLRMLSPDQSTGLLATLKQTVNSSLDEQQKAILRQFSLDDRESALSRLVTELTDQNGRLRKELAEDVEAVRKEFSLDNEDGALSRLVARVEAANQTIMSEFSCDNENSAINRMVSLLETTNESIRASLTLDDENSPLCRLKNELCKTIDEMAQANTRFQSDVRDSLTELKAKREESARSTRHGHAFEDALGEFLQIEARRLNDVFENATACSGTISRCKVGDHVLQLGPDSAAPGSRMVFEAKGDKSYDVSKALNELRTARENREATVGLMVFTPEAAPAGLEIINRWGDDIIVVWDSEDSESDVFLRAAVSLARAMVVADRRARDGSAADFSEMENAVNAILRDVELLGEIQTLATTVKNNGEKIVKKTERLKSGIETQIERLQEHLASATASA